MSLKASTRSSTGETRETLPKIFGCSFLPRVHTTSSVHSGAAHHAVNTIAADGATSMISTTTSCSGGIIEIIELGIWSAVWSAIT